MTTVSPLAPGLRGLAYSAFMTARAGQAPYAWRISGGTPPPGITIDPATGELRGIATAGGDFTFTVAATGLDGSTGEGSVTLPIEYLWFDQIGFPPLSVGKGFRQVLVAAGDGHALRLAGGGRRAAARPLAGPDAAVPSPGRRPGSAPTRSRCR